MSSRGNKMTTNYQLITQTLNNETYRSVHTLEQCEKFATELSATGRYREITINPMGDCSRKNELYCFRA